MNKHIKLTAISLICAGFLMNIGACSSSPITDRDLISQVLTGDNTSAPVSRGKQYALFIAIDNYKNWPTLKKPVGDAQEIRDILQDGYHIDEVVELYNGEATKQNIIKTFTDLQGKLGTHDSLFIYYAGHGYMDTASKTGFWIPVDAGANEKAQENWLPNSQIRGYISQLKTIHVFIASDACFSGDILSAPRTFPAKIDNAYYSKAYSLVSRQVLTSGRSNEPVPDESEFSEALKICLRKNTAPQIDPIGIYNDVRLSVQATTPLYGTLNQANHQEGATFLFFKRKPDDAVVNSVTHVVSLVPGTLYEDNTFLGETNLLNALNWIKVNARSRRNYTITLGEDEVITPTELSYGGKKVTIILKSAGGEHTVSSEDISPSSPLFTIKSGVTFTLEDGVTLRGTQNETDKSLVEVDGGRFVMNGGAITGNKKNGNGGGVYVASGAFTMNGGTISGNSALKNRIDDNRGWFYESALNDWEGGSGGGVYVDSGVFTMNGGTITENSASSDRYDAKGGGVYVNWGKWVPSLFGEKRVQGTFTMNGGAISGNSASSGDGYGTKGGGGGVYVDSWMFIMNGGIISGNSANDDSAGGGVYAKTFTMNGGTISGNTIGNDYRGYGGGVYANAFTMNDGTISGNTSRSNGGGVYANTFTMKDGTISGNTSRSYGGGVYVGYSYAQGTFTKSDKGGVIYGSNAQGDKANRAESVSGHAVYASGNKRDTTAWAVTAMNSKKDGPAGGWE